MTERRWPASMSGRRRPRPGGRGRRPSRRVARHVTQLDLRQAIQRYGRPRGRAARALGDRRSGVRRSTSASTRCSLAVRLKVRSFWLKPAARSKHCSGLAGGRPAAHARGRRRRSSVSCASVGSPCRHASPETPANHRQWDVPPPLERPGGSGARSGVPDDPAPQASRKRRVPRSCSKRARFIDAGRPPRRRGRRHRAFRSRRRLGRRS